MSDRTLLEREKLLFRYSAALERGDFETVAAVLELANDDRELERMILEMNEVYQSEMNREAKGGSKILKFPARPLRWALAAAAVLIVIGLGSVMFLGNTLSGGPAATSPLAQLPSFPALQPAQPALPTPAAYPTQMVGATAFAPTMPPLPTGTMAAGVFPNEPIYEVTPLGGDQGFAFSATPAPTQVEPPTEEVGGPPLPTEQRMIIKNGELRLLVQDTDVAIDQITQIAVDNGGYVLSSQSWMNGPYKAGTVQIAVRSESFETAMRRLRDIAIEVLYETSSGTDVSEEYVDLQSRLRNLEATRDRLLQFLDEAQTIDEALRINNELAAIEAQIEQVKGRMQFLSGRAAYSTIRIDLEEPGPTPTVTPTPTATLTPTPTYTPTPWSLGPQIKEASETQTRLARGLLALVLWLVIVPGPYIAGGVIIWLIVRQVVKKRNTSG